MMNDLSRIRSLKTLEEMRRDLTEFLSNEMVLTVYLEEYNWGEEDYEADKEEAQYLLNKVEERFKSLSRHEAKKKGSSPKKKSGKSKDPGEQ